MSRPYGDDGMLSLGELQRYLQQECSGDWLTPSQAALYRVITTTLQHHSVVNLWGGAGTGKTLLAWTIRNSGYAVYCASPKEGLPHGVSRAVLDNCPSERRAIRRLREDMAIAEVPHTIVISRAPVEDDFPALELPLTPEDIQFCKALLFQRLGLRCMEDSPCRNLHELVLSYFKTGGASHAH